MSGPSARLATTWAIKRLRACRDRVVARAGNADAGYVEVPAIALGRRLAQHPI
jgi:hypothetical protein